MFFFKLLLTLSWRRLSWYRNQSIDFLRKSMDWFLYDNGLRHVKMGKKWRKILSPTFYLKFKNINLFFNWCLYIFFKWSYSQRCLDVAQRCENRRLKWKHCFNVVQRCSVQRCETQRCFNVVLCCKFPRWHTQRCFNVDLTLCDVVATSYQPKINVKLTLKCLLG